MSVAHAPTDEWTVEEYEKLNAAGIFTESDRVELLNGEIIVMSPLGYRHAMAVMRLNEFFVEGSRRRYRVNPGNPVLLDDRSEPQPDLALLARGVDTQGRHPDPSQVFLLIEVSDSSLRYDREDKRPAYARRNIREYWILNLEENVLEVYRNPRDGTYQDVRIVKADETVAPEAFPDLVLRVGDFLP
jgi:Uma2 family endonuclease